MLFFLPLIGFGQYSSYYKVDVNSKITKTVKTIDYGALRQANVMEARNKIEKIKTQNATMIAIAEDPLKAVVYGEWGYWGRHSVAKKQAKDDGFKKFKYKWKQPHDYLMQGNGGWEVINISSDNIKTVLEMQIPVYVYGKKVNLSANSFKLRAVKMGAEEYVKHDNTGVKKWEVGRIYDGRGMLHKVDINKTMVAGNNGFLRTLIFEDDYEYYIQDHYLSTAYDIWFSATVTYKGDKDETTFEDLEGRRYYLKPVSDLIISTADIYDYEKH